MTLSLAQANAIVAGALERAVAMSAKPLGVVVLDAGGQLVSAQRQDGASLFRVDIASGKALGALGMGMDSAALAERAQGNPTFFGSLSAATGGRVVYSAGGVLILDGGEIVGAVGVSGDTGETDVACAKSGIRAAGLDCTGGCS